MNSPEKPAMASFPALDFDLGRDIEMLRDTVQNFAAREIAPRAAQTDERNEFPMDLWRKLGDLGLLGITVGEEYGGAGMGYLAHVVAMEEVSRASASVGLSYGAHSNLCVNQINRNDRRMLHSGRRRRAAAHRNLRPAELYQRARDRSRNAGADRLEVAANFDGRFRLRIKRLVLRRPAGEIKQDARLGATESGRSRGRCRGSSRAKKAGKRQPEPAQSADAQHLPARHGTATSRGEMTQGNHARRIGRPLRSVNGEMAGGSGIGSSRHERRCSAGLQPAVSPIFNRQRAPAGAGMRSRAGRIQRRREACRSKQESKQPRHIR